VEVGLTRGNDGSTCHISFKKSLGEKGDRGRREVPREGESGNHMNLCTSMKKRNRMGDQVTTRGRILRERLTRFNNQAKRKAHQGITEIESRPDGSYSGIMEE